MLVDVQSWIDVFEQLEEKALLLEKIANAAMATAKDLGQQLEREKQLRLDAEFYSDMLADRLRALEELELREKYET